MATKKYSINFEENVIAKVDEYAQQIGVNRTAALTFLIVQGLQSALTPQLIELMNKYDEESLKKVLEKSE